MNQSIVISLISPKTKDQTIQPAHTKRNINLTGHIYIITTSPYQPTTPMSIEQLKQGLLIHLQANRNFIQEKVYKQFAQQCIKEHDILTLDTKKIKKVIKFAFDFGANEDMKPFYENIEKNAKEFVNAEKNRKPPNQNGKVPIDLENLLELILYCINNGFGKLAQKPTPQPPKAEQKPKQQAPKVVKVPPAPAKKQQPPTEPKKQQKKKPQITLLNPELQAKVDKIKLISKPIEPIKVPARISTRLQPDKIPPKVQFKLQKYEMPKVTNVVPRYLQTIQPKPKPQQLPQPSYEPLDPQFSKNQLNRKLMRQRLFDLYKHYCSQQQNTGHNATFDRIKSEMEHMTLGKFLLFCKSSGIFGDLKLVTKDMLVSGFRKVAVGKPEIDFDTFESLIKDLDTNYLASLSTANTPNPATYQARLRLHSNQGYKEFKKWLNMIFFTRDSKNKHNKLFISKFQQRDLTSHSGKFQLDLQEELEKIRHSQTIQVMERRDKSNSLQKDPTKKYRALNIEEIGNKKWPKIDWLEEEFKLEQQAIEEDSMPKIARRKDVVGNLKKRVEQVSKMEMHNK